MKNRRQFLMTGAAGAMLPALAAPLAQAAAPVQRRVGGFPALSEFAALQGAPFELAELGTTVSLHKIHSQDSGRPLEQFTLVLSGKSRQPLNAGLYELRHPKVGSFMVYLAPSGRAADRHLYRADVSLLT
jgi:hypothetical protein